MSTSSTAAGRRNPGIVNVSGIDYLFDLERHGVKLGLDNIRLLLDAAGNPHAGYPAVHVGGTNGKGSVAAMVEAMARAAGYTVGRFTSPHLIDVSERFLIGPEPIARPALEEQIALFRAVAEAMNPPPTFFEMNTAIAFRWFAQRRVDFALIEVGMGGRFDSTNVIDPVAVAITNIDLEHTEFLGDTPEQIAFEKAGIIKPAKPLVLGETRPGPRDVILGRADELGAAAYLLDRDFRGAVSGPKLGPTFRYESASLAIGPVPLALPGDFQRENAAVAVALAERLRHRFPGIDERAIAAGLGRARWPCRLEKVLHEPPVIIDVAHNPRGAQRLAQELPPCITVLAVSRDKDAAGIVRALSPVTNTFVFSQFRGLRGLPVDALCEAAGRPGRRTADLKEAIRLGMELADEACPLVITGSIFAAGEARQILIDDYGAPPLAF